MILYKAIKSNEPFYQKDDAKTKADWLIELNLTDPEFDSLSDDFRQVDTTINCNIAGYGVVENLYLTVARTEGLTQAEANAIKSQIDLILAPYNV